MFVGVVWCLLVGFLEQVVGLGLKSLEVVVGFRVFGFLWLVDPLVWGFGWTVVAFATKQLVTMVAKASKWINCEGQQKDSSVVKFLRVGGCNDVSFPFSLDRSLLRCTDSIVLVCLAGGSEELQELEVMVTSIARVVAGGFNGGLVAAGSSETPTSAGLCLR